MALRTRSEPVSPVRRRRVSPPVPLLIGAGVLAVGLLVVLVLVSGSHPYAVLGNPDPGVVVRLGAPLLRLVSDAAAALCTGLLVFAVCFAGPQPSGLLSARGYAALRSAGRWATVWCLATLALLPFDLADEAGAGLSSVLEPPAFTGLLGGLEQPKAWLITAGVALVVAAGCRATLRWQPAVALLILAVLGLLPPLCTGHSSSDTGHDVATAAILIHVPAAAVWIGVLVALLRPSLRDAGGLRRLARRYTRLALICWLVLAASGLIDAVVLVPPGDLLHTGYGLLLVAKIGLVAVLGLAGAVLRRSILDGSPPDGSAPEDGDGARSRRLPWLAAGELVVLLATSAISVGSTHLVPPAFVGRPITGEQTLLGYDLTGPPTAARLLLDWRFEVLFGVLAAALAIGYLAGVGRLRRAGQHWPAGRVLSWVAGCLVVLLATSSGIGRYGAAMFSVHMVGHMLLSMVAPVLLVLGAPVTLALRALPAAGPGEPYGPHEWVRALSRSTVLRVLVHPLVALPIFVASPFLLYLTGLFDAAVRFHWAHLALDGYFLVVGYLFAWPVLGSDPLPRPLPGLARLGMLLAAMPFDTVFAAVVMTTHTVIGNGPAGANMYQALALPWVPSLLADQRIAGEAALGIGEFVLFVAGFVLLWQWFRGGQTDDLPDLAAMTRAGSPP